MEEAVNLVVMENIMNSLLSSATLPFLIPIVAIIVGGVVVVVRIIIRHQERMVMIDRGMHPDLPPEDSDRRCD